MKTIGIIAEYNPFHNGHKSLIDSAKKSGYSHCVVVMSGNFVQRGQPAITEKRIRAAAALKEGADLVIELPVAYATATAQKFAQGGVFLLWATGCVDSIAFGSESGDTSQLIEAANALTHPDFDSIIVEELKKGDSYPGARARAVEKIAGYDIAQVLNTPNNILAVEYLLAVSELDWGIDPFTIKRQGVGHHSQRPAGGYASATALRKNPTDFSDIAQYMPKSSVELLKDAFNSELYPSQIEKTETAVISHLRRLSVEELARLPDASEGLENRLYSSIRNSTSLDEIYTGAQSKRYTLSRIRRMIIQAYLGIESYHFTHKPPYIRVLGFNQKGRELLAKMNGSAKIPFSHSLKELESIGKTAAEFTRLESLSTDLYTLSLPKAQRCGYDYFTPGVFM